VGRLVELMGRPVELVGRLVEVVGRLLVLAREWAPSEVDQWELAEQEPQLEERLLLGMEPPSKVREARGSPVELSVLGLVSVSVSAPASVPGLYC
jgi:hypothetical protein